MNQVYKLKWKRNFIWHSANIIGHSYDVDINKLIIYFPEGGLREISHWSDCEMILDRHWSAIVKQRENDTDSSKVL